MSRIRAAIHRALVVVESDAMKRLLEDIVDVIESDAPAVIEGERGTGREMIARLVHHSGPRRAAAFVSVEAAAVPTPLFRDELDASASEALRRAAGGTLLVKNMCALGVASQEHLARLVRARGAGGPGALDVRILGACDRDLDAAVEAGVFDAEIYEAMVAHRIALPPLRERAADIPPLAVHFVREYGDQIGRPRISLSTRAFERLVKYPWPGNVAELKDLARRLVVCAKGTRIEAGDVDALLPTVAERIPLEDMSLEDIVRAKLRTFLQRVEGYPVEQLYDAVLARVERPLFELVMEHTGGNQLRAADLLGVNRNTLRRKLAEHGLHARTIRARSKSKASAVKAKKKVPGSRGGSASA